MQMSRRALRMERHHKRMKRSGSGLNLVSMMDIFTILVFFLLVSSGETEVLPNPKDIQLPESMALERARETVVVMVTGDNRTTAAAGLYRTLARCSTSTARDFNSSMEEREQQ